MNGNHDFKCEDLDYIDYYFLTDKTPEGVYVLAKINTENIHKSGPAENEYVKFSRTVLKARFGFTDKALGALEKDKVVLRISDPGDEEDYLLVLPAKAAHLLAKHIGTASTGKHNIYWLKYLVSLIDDITPMAFIDFDIENNKYSRAVGGKMLTKRPVAVGIINNISKNEIVGGYEPGKDVLTEILLREPGDVIYQNFADGKSEFLVRYRGGDGNSGVLYKAETGHTARTLYNVEFFGEEYCIIGVYKERHMAGFSAAKFVDEFTRRTGKRLSAYAKGCSGLMNRAADKTVKSMFDYEVLGTGLAIKKIADKLVQVVLKEDGNFELVFSHLLTQGVRLAKERKEEDAKKVRSESTYKKEDTKIEERVRIYIGRYLCAVYNYFLAVNQLRA